MACKHDYYQIPRTNLAKCRECGHVIYRQNKERLGGSHHNILLANPTIG